MTNGIKGNIPVTKDDTKIMAVTRIVELREPSVMLVVAE